MSTAASWTAVIVSRGLEAMLREAVRCLRAAWPRPFDASRDRVIIVDNGSPVPLTRNGFESGGLVWIRLDRHHGFAAACNLAVRSHPADRLLFLNNDVLLHPGALAEMAECLQAEGVGITGGRLVFPDDTIQHAGVVFFAGDTGPRHAERRRPTHAVSRQRREFQAVTGACMLVRGEVFDALGGFDEDYDFGSEDVDLCLRARQAGWRIVCCQSVDSLHVESMTPGRQERDGASRRLFMERWRGRYAVDATGEVPS